MWQSVTLIAIKETSENGGEVPGTDSEKPEAKWLWVEKMQQKMSWEQSIEECFQSATETSKVVADTVECEDLN